MKIMILLIYNAFIYNFMGSIITNFLKIFFYVIAHFILVTILGVFYVKFFFDFHPLELPGIIVCLYISISPFIFLIMRSYVDKTTYRSKELNKEDNLYLENKKTVQLYFSISIVIQFLILINTPY